MKEIFVENNQISNYKDDSIIIQDGKITFLMNGEYTLDYKNCNDVSLDFELLDGVFIKLFIFSFIL